MAKYRVWYGDEPTYKNVSSLAEALKFFKKNPNYDESNSGIEELVDNYWDEWLDEDDQNVHEHIYMYGGKSKHFRATGSNEEEEEEEIEEDLEELDEDLDEEEADLIDDDEELDDRLLDVIGGGRSGGGDEEDIDEAEIDEVDVDEDIEEELLGEEIDDVEEIDDLDEDLDEDFDEDELDEDDEK